MTFPAPLRIVAVAAICIAALIGLVVREGQARARGTEILLPIEAVDPRSILSGHYVIVAPIETLDEGVDCPTNFLDPHGLENGRGWVAFAPAGDHHRAIGVRSERDAARALSPLIAAGYAQCDPIFTPDAEGSRQAPAVVRTQVGVDRYYAAQDEAMRIENVLRDQRVGEATRAYAIVSIGQDGRARLKGLKIDNERLELGWR